MAKHPQGRSQFRRSDFCAKQHICGRAETSQHCPNHPRCGPAESYSLYGYEVLVGRDLKTRMKTGFPFATALISYAEIAAGPSTMPTKRTLFIAISNPKIFCFARWHARSSRTSALPAIHDSNKSQMTKTGTVIGSPLHGSPGAGRSGLSWTAH